MAEMGKLTRKLVVYLDQNFLSEIAKSKKTPKVHPGFSVIYELLHRGFIDEKVVVPASWYHDVETSFAPSLKAGIRQHQGFLGQVELKFPETVRNSQTFRAAKQFLGEETELLDYRIAFHEDPDRRIQRFKIDVDTDWSRFGFKESRGSVAVELNELRRRLQRQGVIYERQLDRERADAIKEMLSRANPPGGLLFRGKEGRFAEFLNSAVFLEIPWVDISTQLWAKLLTHYGSRPFKEGDQTDIDVISTYLPYVDVLATDGFMAQLVKQLKLDQKYRTRIFDARRKGIDEFATFLTDHFGQSPAINTPDASIFVLPDAMIREESFEFFKALGLQAMTCEGQGRGWVEMYGFNDGRMPSYYDPRAEVTLPFYGLQEVREIKIATDAGRDAILRECANRGRSEKFVLIDHYQVLPENFVEILVESCRAGVEAILQYRIYSA